MPDSSRSICCWPQNCDQASLEAVKRALKDAHGLKQYQELSLALAKPCSCSRWEQGRFYRRFQNPGGLGLVHTSNYGERG